MQIVHPHHPLRGLIVKVLRAAERVGSDEPCWLIEAEGGERQIVAQAWTRPAPLQAALLPLAQPDLPVVDLTSLRQLAIMVAQLSSGQELTANESALVSANPVPADCAQLGCPEPDWLVAATRLASPVSAPAALPDATPDAVLRGPQ